MNYVTGAWYVAAWADELVASQPMAVMILGIPIVLWRGEDGGVNALQDRCVHRYAPLSLGRCEGPNLRCMYHGILFNPEGQAVEIPGQDTIPEKARIRRFPAIERHDWVWVWMGAPQEADPDMIPAAIGLHDPDWVMGRGTMDIAAEGRLISDNLLDFGHVGFLHEMSFGAAQSWRKSRHKVTALLRGVRLERWVTNPDPEDGAVDIWVGYDYVIPGILLMKTARFPAGAAERFNYAAPDPDAPALDRSSVNQAVTPKSPGESRYFFAEGPKAGPGAEDACERRMPLVWKALTEDKTMLEAQQRNIALSPSYDILPISADQAVTLYNRLVDRLARGG